MIEVGVVNGPNLIGRAVLQASDPSMGAAAGTFSPAPAYGDIAPYIQSLSRIAAYYPTLSLRARLARFFGRLRFGNRTLDLRVIRSDGVELEPGAGITIVDLPDLDLRELWFDCRSGDIYRRYFEQDEVYRQYYSGSNPNV